MKNKTEQLKIVQIVKGQKTDEKTTKNSTDTSHGMLLKGSKQHETLYSKITIFLFYHYVFVCLCVFVRVMITQNVSARPWPGGYLHCGYGLLKQFYTTRSASYIYQIYTNIINSKLNLYVTLSWLNCNIDSNEIWHEDDLILEE